MPTRGSLDNPPLVVTTSPWKLVGLCAIAVLFVVLTLYAIGWGQAGKNTWQLYLAGGVFGLAIPVLIWRIVSPARLELSPKGLLWFNGSKSFRYSWSDFSEFRAYRPSPRMRSFFVGFRWTQNSAQRSAASGLVKSISGVDGSFGGNWSVEITTLVNILNEAQKRWGRRSTMVSTATGKIFTRR